MADIDFLSILSAGASQWNQWRAAHPHIKPDLQQAYLFGHNLDGVDLSGANLSRACLIGASLQGANLQNACLQSAYATSANFSQANLRRADLTKGSFSEADFTRANLSEAVVLAANLSSAKLTGACLLRWQMDLTTVVANVQGTYIVLRPKQRQPKEGQFQPGELAAYLQQMAPATQVLRAQQAPVVTVNVAALQQHGQRLLDEAIAAFDTARTTDFSEAIKSQLATLHASEAAQSVRCWLQPDNSDRVTIGWLNELEPSLLERTEQLDSVVALRQFSQTTAERCAARRQVWSAAIASSPVVVGAIAAAQKDPVHRFVQPFRPDGPSRVTVGQLSPLVAVIGARLQAELNQTAISDRYQQLRHQLTVLFTPDSPIRITPGALNQLSPETRQNMRSRLGLNHLTRTCAHAHRTANALVQQRPRLAHIAATLPIARLAQLRGIRQIAPLFRPDSVEQVTLGYFHDVSKAEIRQWTRQAKHYLDPKYAGPRLEALQQRHPVATGIGATVGAIALIALYSYSPRANQLEANESPTRVEVSTSESGVSRSDADLETALMVANSKEPFAALPCQEAAPQTPPLEPLAHTYENGATFYGEFANGQPVDGKGTLIYPTGNRYDGQYENGQRQGCGTFTFANGRRYVGQHQADAFHGKGTWILENGERYIGTFENNKCNGPGTFIFVNGSSKSGIWQQGKLQDSDLSCDKGSLKLPSSPDM